MITIIFLDEQNEPVQLRFIRNDELECANEYGVWRQMTNEIELTEKGWEIFQKHRKQIRKLKPLLDHLDKQ